MSAKHLFGLFFLEGPVHQGTYLTMLQDWFVPQVKRLGLLGHVCFQQECVPAHYAITER
jgi:hypothetical protein